MVKNQQREGLTWEEVPYSIEKKTCACETSGGSKPETNIATDTCAAIVFPTMSAATKIRNVDK